MIDNTKIDYISWMYYMGLWETASIVSDGQWVLNHNGIGMMSNSVVKELTNILIEEILSDDG